jgi:hypothetical protein
MTKPLSEGQKFDAGIRKILSVSREEMKRREEEWQREKQRTKKKRAKKHS